MSAAPSGRLGGLSDVVHPPNPPRRTALQVSVRLVPGKSLINIHQKKPAASGRQAASGETLMWMELQKRKEQMQQRESISRTSTGCGFRTRSVQSWT